MISKAALIYIVLKIYCHFMLLSQQKSVLYHLLEKMVEV